MELIKQDFCFEAHSLTHGRFIVDCNDMYPTGKITEVKHVFPLKTGFVYLNFASPEDTATWLKLKYGGALVERPAPPTVSKDIFSAFNQHMKDMEKFKEDRKKYVFDIESVPDPIWETTKRKMEFFEESKRKKRDEEDMKYLQELINRRNNF